MQLTITVLTLYIFQKCNAVKIDASSNDPNIEVVLTPDPRGINKITSNDEWKMYQAWDDPLYDWGLEMTLKSRKYAFQSGRESKLTIEMDGFCDSNECDALYAFSVGGQYITLSQDFDGYFTVDGTTGVFMYPACNTNIIATGDASQLVPDTPSEFTPNGFRDALAGGDRTNYFQLTSSQNGRNFPVTLEFINDDLSDTFTFKFKSSTFPDGKECTYHSARATGEDFKFFFSPHGGKETIKVKSFDISGQNIGTDCEFCDCAASAHALFDGAMRFDIHDEDMTEIDQPLNVRTIIWSGVISMIISLMTVFISYIVCIKPKTNTHVYDKVIE